MPRIEKKPARAFMYSEEFPKGKMFLVDELPELGDEWVDHPDKITGEPAAKATNNDLMQAYLNGKKITGKDTFVEIAEGLGAEFAEGVELPTVKELKAGIELTLREAALLAEVARDKVTIDHIADYLKATKDEVE